MKRSVILIAAAALLALAGCGDTDKSSRVESKASPAGIIAPDGDAVSSALAGSEETSSVPDDQKEINWTVRPTYPVEEVFPDSLFVSIIDGETVPVKLICGSGGEGGYNSYPVTDPGKIKEFIEAFRMMTIKEVITDRDEMNNIMDGITDLIFETEDGRQTLANFDCCTYVMTDDEQYVFENNEKLRELFHEVETEYWSDLSRQEG